VIFGLLGFMALFGAPPPWVEGAERARLVEDAAGAYVRVVYPKGAFGNGETGVQWKAYLPRSYERLRVSYAVYFEPGFDFVRGGKLPGLVGGFVAGSRDSVVSGGRKPNGYDGWSARLMWRKGGRVVQYLYHPDQPGSYGEDLRWQRAAQDLSFTPGRWHRVTTEITLNTPGRHDGILRSWLDGGLALAKNDLRFRETPSIGIDALYVSTFFGGDDAAWSTTKDEAARFRDFTVTVPVIPDLLAPWTDPSK